MTNDDLIRRGDVIDFVKNSYYDLAESMEDMWAMVADVEKLPSAQPEIVRCKDCKHGSPNGRYGCTVYHYKRYETHDMKPDDFCSFAERRTDE